MLGTKPESDHEVIHQDISSPGWEMKPLGWGIEDRHKVLDRQPGVSGVAGLACSVSPSPSFCSSCSVLPATSALFRSQAQHILGWLRQLPLECSFCGHCPKLVQVLWVPLPSECLCFIIPWSLMCSLSIGLQGFRVQDLWIYCLWSWLCTQWAFFLLNS